jgi:hypothetical protein
MTTFAPVPPADDYSVTSAAADAAAADTPFSNPHRQTFTVGGTLRSHEGHTQA